MKVVNCKAMLKTFVSFQQSLAEGSGPQFPQGSNSLDGPMIGQTTMQNRDQPCMMGMGDTGIVMGAQLTPAPMQQPMVSSTV